jgi:hypothetical protein
MIAYSSPGFVHVDDIAALVIFFKTFSKTIPVQSSHLLFDRVFNEEK